jgi:Rap1a immunity proteins
MRKRVTWGMCLALAGLALPAAPMFAELYDQMIADSYGGYFQSGNQLLERGAQNMGTIGYVMGVLDSSLKRGASRPPICAPSEVTGGQAAAIVIAHMNKYPETRHLSAAVVTHQAMARHYRCE